MQHYLFGTSKLSTMQILSVFLLFPLLVGASNPVRALDADIRGRIEAARILLANAFHPALCNGGEQNGSTMEGVDRLATPLDATGVCPIARRLFGRPDAVAEYDTSLLLSLKPEDRDELQIRRELISPTEKRQVRVRKPSQEPVSILLDIRPSDPSSETDLSYLVDSYVAYMAFLGFLSDSPPSIPANIQLNGSYLRVRLIYRSLPNKVPKNATVVPLRSSEPAGRLPVIEAAFNGLLPWSSTIGSEPSSMTSVRWLGEPPEDGEQGDPEPPLDVAGQPPMKDATPSTSLEYTERYDLAGPVRIELVPVQISSDLRIDIPAGGYLRFKE